MTATHIYTKLNKPSGSTISTYGSVTKEMQDKANINHEEWLHILFEAGCMFIENKVDDRSQQLKIMEAVDFDFWSWWVLAFIQDDRRLLNTRCSNKFFTENYKELKEEMAIFMQIENVDSLNRIL